MRSQLLCRIVFCCIVFYSSQSALAQTTFYKTYGHAIDGGEGRNVKQAKDGGYFLTYYIYYASKFVTCLTKLNCAGEKEWDKVFDCGYTTIPVELISQSDNGCLLTLSTKKNAGDWEATILRLDDLGNALWTTSVKMHIANSVGSCVQGNDQNIYVCGSILAQASNTNGTAIAKITPDGTLVWLKHYYDNTHHTPLAITITSENKIAICGYAGFTTQPFTNMYVMLCESNGNFIKRRIFETTYDDNPRAICSDKAGNIYVTGYSYFLTTAWDMMFLKLNNQLDILQSKFYDAGTAQGEQARYVISTSNNSIAVFGDEGGFNERNPMMMLLNENGNFVWAKSYAVSPAFTNYCFYGAECTDGGFLLTGDVRPPSQFRIAPIIKTKADGDARCFTNSKSFTERNETLNILDTALLVTTLTDTAGTDSIPALSLTTTQSMYCSYLLPCGDFKEDLNSINCDEACYHFNEESVQATSWLWTFENGIPDSSSSQVPPLVCYKTPGSHKITLELKNSKGSTIYQKNINSILDCPIIIPNVFTPNNDEANDTFIVDGVYEEFSLQIFNRWGAEIFSAPYPGKWWNGSTSKGEKVPDGVYFYVLKLGTENESYHGKVHLFR